MRVYDIIQCGDAQQCSDNGIEGDEFSFGIRDESNAGSHHYHYVTLSAIEHESIWSIAPEYRTNFRLTLTY